MTTVCDGLERASPHSIVFVPVVPNVYQDLLQGLKFLARQVTQLPCQHETSQRAGRCRTNAEGYIRLRHIEQTP